MKSLLVFLLLLLPFSTFTQIVSESTITAQIKSKGINIKTLVSAQSALSDPVRNTAIIQKALQENSYLIFPPYPILIDSVGLRIPSGRSILFESGSQLMIVSMRSPSYAVVAIDNASDVILVNPFVTGERKSHLGSTGQQGMGIAIRSSKNVTIFNGKATDCWGDGLYIGRKGKQGVNSKNIRIIGFSADNNRRNGVSVVTVEGLYMESVYSRGANGQLPMAGIDIEPNGDGDRLIDINLRNIYTSLNGGKGLQIGISKLLGTSTDSVSVIIENFRDSLSQSGIVLGCKVGKDMIYAKSIRGNIQLIKPVLIGNPRFVNFEKYTALAPLTVFHMPELYTINESGKLTLKASSSNGFSFSANEKIRLLNKP